MLSPEGYTQQYQAILHRMGIRAGSPDTTTPTSAQKVINDAKALLANAIQSKKELYLLKKEVNLAMRQISSSYVARRSAIGGTGIFGSIFGRKAAGTLNVARRQNITTQKDNALLPYRQLITKIDKAILFLDEQKLVAEEAIVGCKAVLSKEAAKNSL